jgi:hypothetical protein
MRIYHVILPVFPNGSKIYVNKLNCVVKIQAHYTTFPRTVKLCINPTSQLGSTYEISTPLIQSSLLDTVPSQFNLPPTEQLISINVILSYPNGDLQKLYSSPNDIRHIKSRRMRWAGHVACIGEKCVQRFDGKREGKRPLGRSRRRWEDGIRMDLRETVCGGYGVDSPGSE